MSPVQDLSPDVPRRLRAWGGFHQLKWSLPVSIPYLAWAVYFLVLPETEKEGPLWVVLLGIGVLVAGTVALFLLGYLKGPVSYEVAGVTFDFKPLDTFVPQTFMAETLGEFGRRWEEHPDTQCKPLEIWRGYKVFVRSQITEGASGAHYIRSRRIELKDSAASDESTLRWEFGHALMYAEGGLGTEGVVDPTKYARVQYEKKWLEWRKSRGLL